MSLLTQLLHVFLGAPLSTTPITFILVHFFTQLFSSFRSTCPNHLNLPLCILFSTHSMPKRFKSSSFIMAETSEQAMDQWHTVQSKETRSSSAHPCFHAQVGWLLLSVPTISSSVQFLSRTCYIPAHVQMLRYLLTYFLEIGEMFLLTNKLLSARYICSHHLPSRVGCFQWDIFYIQ